MDGASVVTLIIVILFFFNINSVKTSASSPYPPGSLPASSSSSSTGSSYPTNTTETAALAVAETASSAETVSQLPDRSGANYQYISDDRYTKIIKKYNKNISQSEIDQIKIATNLYCKEKDLDPRLILALMARESGFKPNATSASGAKGLGQILPDNFQMLEITDPYDINQNIRGLTYYFRQKLDEWRGQNDQLGLALASYLMGSNAIKRDGGKYDGHTATYVNDILRIRNSI